MAVLTLRQAAPSSCNARINIASNGIRLTEILKTKELWSDGRVNYFASDNADKFASVQPQTRNDVQQAFAFANGASSSLASTIPCIFFKLNFGDILANFSSGRTNTRREADDKIGDVDCFVLVSVLDATKVFAETKLPKSLDLEIQNPNTGVFTTMFWIGKKDHRIHQV